MLKAKFENLMIEQPQYLCADDGTCIDEIESAILWDVKRGQEIKLSVIDCGLMHDITVDDVHIAGNEFGYTHLILSDSFDSAWEEFIDQSETIPESELPDAYGAFDKFVEHMEKLGHENAYQLREFCTRYESDFFRIESERMQEAGDYWELIEGYEYQSNFTGTGIVFTGHCTYLHELTSIDDFKLFLSGSLD